MTVPPLRRFRLRPPLTPARPSVVLGIFDFGYGAWRDRARLSINGAWTSTSILTPPGSRVMRRSHASRPSRPGARTDASRAAVRIARRRKWTLCSAIAQSIAGSGATGFSADVRKMMLVQPNHVAPSGSARALPSLRMSARSNSSRHPASGMWTRSLGCACTSASPRTLARPGRVTTRIVAGHRARDPLSGRAGARTGAVAPRFGPKGTRAHGTEGATAEESCGSSSGTVMTSTWSPVGVDSIATA